MPRMIPSAFEDIDRAGSERIVYLVQCRLVQHTAQKVTETVVIVENFQRIVCVYVVVGQRCNL